MGFFKYPYTDLNELNLDWVIAKIKYIERAKNIIYDNTGTTLISNNVQDAIDEIYNMISSQGVTSFNGRSGVVVPEAGDYTATQVTYDNTGTGYTATDVQAAIDEADAKIEAVSQTVPVTYVETFNGRSGAVTPDSGDYSGAQVSYDNTLSGLTATDIQAAVDELAAAPGGVTSFNTRTGAVVPAASDYTAAQVDFDDTVAQTGSSNVQGALQYVATRGASAQYTTYDNTLSGLTATNVQDAIDEVANDVLSSGVASFNGRTGAVNPAAGDYDLTELGDVSISTPSNDDVLKYDSVSQKWVNGAGGGGGTAAGTTYDNTLSGLAATNVQAAIDEIDAMIDQGYILTQTVTITPAAATDTVQNRLKALADAIVAAGQALANDEILLLTSARCENSQVTPLTAFYKIDNTITSYSMEYTQLRIEPANSRYQLRAYCSSTTLTSCFGQLARTTTGNQTTIDDRSSTSTSATFSADFIKFKKL